MVFAHGFGCDQRMWRWVSPAFEDDYRVIAFDYVGAGGSDLSAYSSGRYSSLDGYVQDLLEILEDLRMGPVILVGHSVSSSIALLASVRRPELFSKLVLLSPSPCFLNHPPEYYGGFERQDIDDLLELVEKNPMGWAGSVAPLVIPQTEQSERRQELEDSFCSIPPEIIREFARVTFLADNRRDLKKVTVPCLILQSQDDALAPVSVGEYLQQNLPGSSLQILPVAGHCSHMTDPEITIEAIRNYLQ